MTELAVAVIPADGFEDPAFRARRTQNWMVLGLLYAFFYATRYNLSATSGQLCGYFGWTNTQYGVFETMGPLVYGASVLVNGPIADRIGGKKAFLFGAVGVEGLDLGEGADGLVDDRAFSVDELEVEAHGGEGEEEVGEDDGGVDTEALGGGDGDFGGDFGGAADFEEGVMLADGHVLGHIAAGLAEEPDGSAVHGLAEAGAHEAAGSDGLGIAGRGEVGQDFSFTDQA